MLGEPRRCQLFAPPHLNVRVICDHDHILSGLFIVFKLSKPVANDPWADVDRVMEGTTPPNGEAPKDPDAPQPIAMGMPGMPRRVALPPKEQAQARKDYAEKKARWEQQWAAARDRGHDPKNEKNEFVVGFVDDDGYLVPVHDNWNPWYDASTRRDPDSYKLGRDEVYSACLIRHPDPELARAVARHLNNEPREGDERYGIAQWETPLVSDLTVKQGNAESGDEYVFRLAEDPTKYFPTGPSEYGGWTLYLDMPHAMCGKVPDHVEQLQKDLALLRYPTGDRNPFEFRTAKGEPILDTYLVSRSLADRVKFAKEQKAKPKLSVSQAKYMQKTVFRMQTQVAAAVGRFQEHVQAHRYFELSHKDVAHSGRSSWVYLLGSERSPLMSAEDGPGAWDVPAYLYPGVVDAYTAGMIATWKDRGLRKPGQILIETIGASYRGKGQASAGEGAWSIWMREPAAIAVNAWSELIRAFGVAYKSAPLFAGSSFRRPIDDPWPGSIKGSPHNSGLAVDLAGGGYRDPNPFWPVCAEAESLIDKQAKLEDTPEGRARSELGDLANNLYFKLYGHSTLSVFEHQQAALKTLHGNLGEYIGAEGPPGKFRQGTLYRKCIDEFACVDDEQILEYLDEALRPALTHARALKTLVATNLIASYFRPLKDVRQFSASPYEADGGTTAADAPTVDAGALGFVPKSFVNISALAYELGMERIPAHKKPIRDAHFMNPHGPVARVELSVLQYLIKASADSDLVTLLSDISSPAPQNVHINEEIECSDRTNPEASVKVTARDLDRDFIRDWRTKLLAAPPSLQPKSQASADPSIATGAQMRVWLSVGTTKQDVQKAAAILAGFPTQQFVIAHAGGKLAERCPERTLLTGAQAAKIVREAQADFTKLVDEHWKKNEVAWPDAEPPKMTWDQIRGRMARQADRSIEYVSAPPVWSLVLQPVFLSSKKTVDPARIPFLPTHSVMLPRSSSPSHLEWWHFQFRSTEATWGDAAEAVGWSKAFLAQPREGPAEAAPIVHRGGGFQNEVGERVGSYNQGLPGNSRPSR